MDFFSVASHSWELNMSSYPRHVPLICWLVLFWGKKNFPKWWWKIVIYHGVNVKNHLQQAPKSIPQPKGNRSGLRLLQVAPLRSTAFGSARCCSNDRTTWKNEMVKIIGSVIVACLIAVGFGGGGGGAGVGVVLLLLFLCCSGCCYSCLGSLTKGSIKTKGRWWIKSHFGKWKTTSLQLIFLWFSSLCFHPS